MKAILKILILSTVFLTAQPALADNKKENKNSEAASEKEVLTARLLETEEALLQEYFNSLQTIDLDIASDSAVVIYTRNGACVYKGEKSTAKDLLNKSAFLFEFDNEEHYVIAE